MLYRILTFCFVVAKGFSLEYGLDVKQEGKVPIKSLQIFSERCSGSNYFHQLLNANFFFEKNWAYGHKHFPPWFTRSIDQVIGNPNQYTFEGNEDTLFVVIFRNPYDWLRSLHRFPFHATAKLHGRPFGEFIRIPWEVDPKLRKIVNPLIDLNPATDQPFENVIHLRTAKIQNMLLIKERVSNIYYINYERVRDYPEEVINEIARVFGLVPKQSFISISYYKDNKMQPYKKKKYQRIRKKDVAYINSQLDHQLEESIGYRIAKYPHEIE